jgi:soluble lytic murein transglycosylase
MFSRPANGGPLTGRASFYVFPLLLVALFTVACKAQPPESVALGTLRELSARGSFPPESVVADFEGRYAGTRAGALARLLRARIKFENGDPTGAAALLESDMFAKMTELGDYALWLRGKALLAAKREKEAQDVFSHLLREYPGSLRARDARLLMAESMLGSGDSSKVPGLLKGLIESNDGPAMIYAAQAYEKTGDRGNSVALLRRAYFFAAGTDSGKTAFARLTELGENTEPSNASEMLSRANELFAAKRFSDAADAFAKAAADFPSEMTSEARLNLVAAYAKAGKTAEAASALNRIPSGSEIRPEAQYRLVMGFAAARQWPDAQAEISNMRRDLGDSEWTPKAMIDAGMEARDQKRRREESELLTAAVTAYPKAIDVAKAQFELAWLQHESGNFEISSRMLTEHLARYVDKDNTYRGQTGYWAARDSERAGKLDESCALYDGTVYRYGANWYGYLALDRLTKLRREGKCQATKKFVNGSLVAEAVENLKVVTVAAETADRAAKNRLKKSEDLSDVGIFDWSVDELQEAKRTADNSPSVNLALAKHYRLKGDNVNALLALAKSYPDYAQMFPEEMTREEWDIFYPLVNWGDIKFWAGKRNLDPYHVAGLIRQETIFNPKAKSSANAYGLMQLLLPTARTMARKYGSNTSAITATSLFDPALNIELGTAYMREQLDKYGRLEYMSVAYNAGPGRVVSWRKTLPQEMDEFVEEIPFNETRGYVKGVIRNSAQYRRLYDMNGRFKENVGTRPLRAAIDSKPPKAFAAAFPHVLVERISAGGE